jgi:hypothetical protein
MKTVVNLRDASNWENFLLSEEQLASQEVLCFMELVSLTILATHE